MFDANIVAPYLKQFHKGDKNPQTPSFGREVKPEAA
jgi:hypothetical protein